MTEARRPRAAAGGSPVPEQLRRPLHFGMLFGISTGLYATTLVGTAILQQQADDDLAAARAPIVAQADELRAANDQLATTIRRVDSREAAVSRSYETIRAEIDDVEATLGDLATLVGEVRGAAAALPERISLPAIPSGGSVRIAAKAPPTHATTGASGGG